MTRNHAINFVSGEIVFDPELPEDIRFLLADNDRRHLIPFGRQGAPPQVASGEVAYGCFEVICFLCMAGFAVGAVAARTTGGTGFLAVLSVISGILFFVSSAEIADERNKRDNSRRMADTAARFHRRYVVPGTDLDTDSNRVWRRAVNAANQIGASGVVREQLIDSVPVVAVMPYRLWEIAERLAKLTMVRGAQSEALHGTDPDHPDLAPAVGRQRRAQDLASADVERRVRNLEVLAGRVREADAAKVREAAARRLHDLDRSHLDLLGGLGAGVAGPDMTERVMDDIDTVIEQSRRAIREANEAARSLLPDDDDEPGDGDEGTRP